MNGNKNIIVKIALLIAISLCGCQGDDMEEDFDKKLEQIYAKNHLPSLSACILTENGIQWTVYKGYANKENEKKADEGTVYHIGSISKLFILTAIMQLEEQGKINLDEDINQYLPIKLRHPNHNNVPITTRMLLTHTTGLSKPGTFNSQNGMWNLFAPDQGPSPSDWIPMYLTPSGSQYDAKLWQSVPPGKYEIYSNIGTCVAAYIVEQISGMDFRQYCSKNIFGPLSMQHTSYNYADLDWNKIALLYDRNGHGSQYFDNRVYASGGVKSTINDLSKFAQCYLNYGIYNGTRILNEATVDKIFKLQNPATGRCLIWQISGGEWYGHIGGLELGASTTLAIHPESKTGFIIFTNAHLGIVNPGGEIYWLIRQKSNEYMD
jgi:CubicO group peptidase (beta-lactamase class C family)